MALQDIRTHGVHAPVAVVVPIYRIRLGDDEKLSLRHLETFLGRYPRYALMPRSLDFDDLGDAVKGFERAAFDDSFFRSVADYSRLLLSADFYRAFAAYRHILIYQLDGLVFSDELEDWCRAPWDYLGAPWLADPERPARGFSRVGNGGFSLRSVAGAVKVLEAPPPGPRQRFLTIFRALAGSLPELDGASLGARLRTRWRLLRDTRRGAAWYAAHYTLNEDHFWSDRAPLFTPGFRIPAPRPALRFAFERAPRHCFEVNDGRLPFGCHAWARWDRAFWEPHLLV